MAGPKQAFDEYIAGRARRHVIAPFAEHLAARIAGTSYQEMTGDTASWATSLQKMAGFLKLDGVVVGADTTLLAEALGAPMLWQGDWPKICGRPDSMDGEVKYHGRLGAAVETADRLFQIIRGAHGCIAAMVGPLTLANQIYGEEGAREGLSTLKAAVVLVAEAFAKTRPDILLLIETVNMTGCANLSHYRRIISAIKNVGSYYNIKLGIYVEGDDPAQVSEISGLNADLYILGEMSCRSASLIGDFGNFDVGLGLALPMDKSARVAPDILGFHEWRDGNPALLITSFGEIAADVEIENLRNLLTYLGNIPLEKKRQEESIGI